jgi:hypothetical protein
MILRYNLFIGPPFSVPKEELSRVLGMLVVLYIRVLFIFRFALRTRI